VVACERKMVYASGDEAVAVVRDNREEDLKVRGLTPKQVVQLAEALKTDTTLTTLNLRGMFLSALVC